MAIVNPRSRRVPWPALFLAAAGIGIGVLAIGSAARAQPLGRAWEAARAAGGYAFDGTTRSETVGGVSSWAVSGRGEASGALTVALSSALAAPGPSSGIPAAAIVPSTTWRIRWPRVVDAAGQPLARRAIGGVLPAGDPLALLAAGHGARLGALETVGDIACRRIDFLVGARAYGTWWEGHPGVLPVNGEAGGLWTFQATATAWLDPASHRPCRIVARVELPRLGDDRPGTGEVDWTYAWAESRHSRP